MNSTLLFSVHKLNKREDIVLFLVGKYCAFSMLRDNSING